MGALKAFIRSGINPDFITANSAGSLNACGLSYAGIDELEAMWRTIKKRDDVFKKRWSFIIKYVFGAPSFFDSTPLKLKIDKLMHRREAKIPMCVNVVSLKTGLLAHVWNNSENFNDYVLASASIPLICQPVKGHLVDGGIRENSPLRIAVEHGADRIFLFLNSPKDRMKERKVKAVDSISEIAKRTLEIIMDEAFVEDLALTELCDHEASGKKLELIIVQPEKEYLDTLDFDQLKISNAIDHGFHEANLLIHGLKKDA